MLLTAELLNSHKHNKKAPFVRYLGVAYSFIHYQFNTNEKKSNVPRCTKCEDPQNYLSPFFKHYSLCEIPARSNYVVTSHQYSFAGKKEIPLNI